MDKQRIKILRRFRAKQDLTLQILRLVDDFKSKEEPTVKLTAVEKINVLSSIITRKTD